MRNMSSSFRQNSEQGYKKLKQQNRKNF